MRQGAALYRSQWDAIASICGRAHDLSLSLWACAWILGEARQLTKVARDYEYGDRLTIQVRAAAAELLFYRELMRAGYSKTLGEYFRRVAYDPEWQTKPAEVDLEITDDKIRKWFDVKVSSCRSDHRYVIASARRAPAQAGGLAMVFCDIGTRAALVSDLIHLPANPAGAGRGLIDHGFEFSDLGGRIGTKDFVKERRRFILDHSSFSSAAIKTITGSVYSKAQIEKAAQAQQLREYMADAFRIPCKKR